MAVRLIVDIPTDFDQPAIIAGWLERVMREGPYAYRGTKIKAEDLDGM